jgi:adenylosuccinate synthase
VLGVAKAYATRVGGGPFPTELEDEVGERLRVRGNEYGSVTGRPRRCGWFDAAGLRRVVEINGISGLCITKLDVLDGLDLVRVAVGYKVRGERRDLLPVGADALAICAPIYEELPGWKESTEGVKSFEDLPKNAQSYLRRLEVLVGAPIAIISTGPDRLETIILKHPFD